MDILDKLSIDSEDHSGQNMGNATIGGIVKILGEKFKQEMDKESFGKTTSSVLMFPIMFIIYMHPDDFQFRKPFFDRWGPIILAEIYALIRKKKQNMELRHRVLAHIGKRYPKVEYLPTDARWCIQFTVDASLQKGKIRCDTSYTIPFKVEFANNAPRIVPDSNFTITTRNSKTKGLEERSLDGIRVLGEGIRIYMFDKTLQEDPDKINELHDDKKKELARLKWGDLEWTMYDSYIEISGKEETRNESHILKINSDKVKRTHVAIRYRDNEFQLAAWGETMLNERYVELSKDTTRINWVKLSSKSSIVLNNAIVVRFNANPDLI